MHDEGFAEDFSIVESVVGRTLLSIDPKPQRFKYLVTKDTFFVMSPAETGTPAIVKCSSVNTTIPLNLTIMPRYANCCKRKSKEPNNTIAADPDRRKAPPI